MIKKKKRNHSGFKLASFIIIGLILIGVCSFFIYRHNHMNTRSTSELTKAAENQQVNENKASLPATNSQPSQNTNTKSGSISTSTGSTSSTPSTTLYISGASDTDNSIQVSSYVEGVFENGGKCTLTLTNNGTVITRTDQGIENANYTTCPRFTIDNMNDGVLSSGQWSAVVSYSSSTTSVSSQPTTIEVQ
jgi:hypothetical protein